MLAAVLAGVAAGPVAALAPAAARSAAIPGPLAQDPEPAAQDTPGAGQDEAPPARGGRGRGQRGKRRRDGGAGGRDATPGLDERREVYAREEELRLVAIERDVVEALIRFRPWLAAERGAFERVRGLGGFTGPRFGEWESALEEASLDLVEVQRRALPAERRREAAWLEGWLQSERMLLAALPAKRTDPSYYVEGLLRSLSSLAQPEAPQRFLRMERLAILLAKVPDACEGARNSIRQPVGAWLDLGRERVGELVELIEVDLAERARAVEWTEEERELFERRRLAALEAVQQFSEWMDSRVGERTGEIRGPVGGLWEKLIELRLGLVVDPDAERLAARAHIGRLQSALSVESAQLPQRVPKFRPRAIERVVLDECERLRGLVAGTAWPQPPDLELRVEGLRAEQPGEPYELLNAGPGRWTLALGMPSNPWPQPARVDRARWLHPHLQRALALRYGPTGETGLLESCARSTTLTRSWIPNRTTVEGYGLYATHVARVAGWVPDEDAGYRHALQRLQLLAAARFVLAIDLHVKSAPLDEIVRAYMDHTGCDPLTARRELLWTSRDPFRGLDYLVFVRLLELEGADPERAPASVAEAAARALAAEPCARIGDLLVELRQ